MNDPQSQIELLKAEIDELRREQRRLEDQLQRQQRELQAVSRRVQSIFDSRIWRTLVTAGGLLRRRPSTKPAASVRATAARYSDEARSIDEWTKILARLTPPPLTSAPRITIITPAWNAKLAWFAEGAVSILEQSSRDWEWCIVDDASTSTEFQALFPVLEQTGRVKIQRLDQHSGISAGTNAGLAMAASPFVCFLDHDDLLAPTAIEECLVALNLGNDAVYTDQDKIDERGFRIDTLFKPDWSPEYLRGMMYAGHLLCVRRGLALEAGGFDSRFDGVQDFEFLLRYSERAKRIGHVSRILYHWRAVPGSFAASLDAKDGVGTLQPAAVQAQLDRLNLPARAERGAFPHRVRIMPEPLREHPHVSILIPTKDAPEVLETCLSSLFETTRYPNVEVICIDNQTTDARALKLMNSYRVKRIPFDRSFNFSAANNLGAAQAAGEYLVFMNNDIQTITPRWIEEMLYYAAQDDAGAIGALLLYRDGSVQHAGVVLGCRGTADHVSRRAPGDSDGYAGSLSCSREVSAVTAACMMVKKSLFDRAGGFDERYASVYQDVDLCLTLRALGMRNLLVAPAIFHHLESHTRGSFYNPADRARLLDRWGAVIRASDPYYNPNFDLDACDYSVRPTAISP